MPTYGDDTWRAAVDAAVEEVETQPYTQLGTQSGRRYLLTNISGSLGGQITSPRDVVIVNRSFEQRARLRVISPED